MANVDSMNSQDSISEVQRLKQEIDKLTRLQSDALHHSIYVGMTRDEANEYDSRGTEITRLIKQLGALAKANG